MAEHNPYSAPQVVGRDSARYDRIGGWLILVALGLVATAAIGAFGALGCVVLLVTGDGSLSTYYVVFSLVQVSVLGVAALVGLVLMFRRLRVFPKYMIYYLLTALLLSIGSMAIGGVDSTEIQDTSRAAIACAIWIPYFNVSKRVKGTFVR